MSDISSEYEMTTPILVITTCIHVCVHKNSKHIFRDPPPRPASPPPHPATHTGHVITGNLKIIFDSRIRSIIYKGPKYRYPSRIDFKKCREEIAIALNDFGNRWCKREYVEPSALKNWKLSIFKIIDKRIEFYSRNTILLPHKPKSSFRHLKQGIQEFHRMYVLVPADKAANNVIVV